MRQGLLRTVAIATLSMLGTAAAFPAADMLLQIKNLKGEVIATTKVAADGSFHFDTVPPGQFVLTLVVDGKPVAAAPGSSPQVTFEVRTARESSSGMATGKRQHNPVTFHMELGRQGPVISGTVDGQTVSGKVINNSHSNIKN